MQSILDRSVTKATPGPFRTRVITDGVIASLHIDYKGTRIKQYHKEGQALRTETPSITRATSTSARVLSTCRHCAGSGFRPTAVCWKCGSTGSGVLLPAGFSNRQLRAPLAQLPGQPEANLTQGRMSCHLRRLRLRGLIRRIRKPIAAGSPTSVSAPLYSARVPTPGSSGSEWLCRWRRPLPFPIHCCAPSTSSNKKSAPGWIRLNWLHET
jgi:hypothetical protein